MQTFDIKVLEECYKQECIANSFENLYRTLGFVAAVASSPENVEPSEWIEELVITEDGVPVFDSEEQVKNFTSHLIAWWNDLNQLFEYGGTVELPKKIGLTASNKPNKALKEFSTGYLDGFDWLSKCWQALLPEENEEANRTLTVLHFILARFIDESVMAKEEPELYKQLPDTQGCLKVLPNLLSGVGMLGRDIALEEQAQEEATDAISPFYNENKSVGRNDPCPCGSGKKFKKCCLH